MTVSDLETLFEYGRWANRKLFQVIAQLPPERFTQDVAGSYGSIRNTLVHTLSAEWGWLARCGGPTRGPALKPADFPSLESVTEAWSRVEESMRELLAGLKDADLVRTVAYTNPRGETRSMPLAELLQHAAIHGVHHRGQVALLLRMLGQAPGNFDILYYYAEKHGVPAF